MSKGPEVVTANLNAMLDANEDFGETGEEEESNSSKMSLMDVGDQMDAPDKCCLLAAS